MISYQKRMHCFPFWNPDKQKMENMWVGIYGEKEANLEFDYKHVRHLIKKHLGEQTDTELTCLAKIMREERKCKERRVKFIVQLHQLGRLILYKILKYLFDDKDLK